MLESVVVARMASTGGVHGRLLQLTRLLICAVVAIAALLMIGSSVARAESLCTDTWTGPAEGSWATPSDWSTGKVPGSTDVACIGSGKTVTLTGTQSVGVVQGEGALVIAGTLELASALEASQMTTVTLSGGTFKGVGTLRVTGAFTGKSSGKIEGSGELVVGLHATATIPSESGWSLALTGGTLRNEGTLTVGEDTGLEGSNKAKLVNTGTLIMNDQTPSSNHGLYAYTSTKGEALLVNTGTVEKTEGTGAGYIDFEVTNEGEASVATGQLYFAGGGLAGARAGVWSSSGSGIVELASTLNLGSEATFSGAVELTNGEVTVGELSASNVNLTIKGTAILEHSARLDVTGSEASTVKNLTFSCSGANCEGGELKGAGTVDVTGTFIGGGFSDYTGSGALVIKPGATGHFTHQGSYSFSLYGSTLRNEGTLTVEEGTGLGGANKAKLINTSTLIMNDQTPGENHGLNASSTKGEALLVNTGTIEKTEGTSTGVIKFEIENEAEILVDSGKLTFSGGGSAPSHPGTWTASSGSQITFVENFNLGKEATLSGSFEDPSGGEVTVGKLNGSNANLTFVGSTVEGYGARLNVTGAEPSTIHNLTFARTGTEGQRGCEMKGAGTVDVTGTFVGGGGSIYTGSGALVLKPGATGHFVKEGASSFSLSGSTLRNEGTLDIEEGTGLQGGNKAKLINTGTLIMNDQTPNYNQGLWTSGKGEALLVNTGTVEKTEGTGTGIIKFEFENLGRLINDTLGVLKIEYPIAVESSESQYGTSNPSALGPEHPTCGKPVDCVTGNETETQSDIGVGGRGVGLDLTRTYNAQAAAAGEHGVFGYGWSSSFSDHLVFNGGAHTVTVVQANGSTVSFSEEGGKLVAPVWTQDTLTGSGTEGYTLTMSSQKVYKFSGAGRLEGVADRNGNTTSLGYNEKGQLATITDPSGRKITLAYNGEGLVESATDPMGHVVKYAYESGALSSVTMPSESSPRWKFKYDASHRMTSMVNGLGGETVNTYNASNQVTVQKEPNGATLKWEYETFRTKITNEATGSVTLEEYTSADELDGITRGYGTSSATTEAFTYNERGEPLTRTDGNGHATSYEYDGEGNRVKQTDPEGHETKWTYNAKHEPTSETLPSGEKTTIEYDEHGNPVKVSRPAPEAKTQETKYEYNGVGELSAVIDPLARKWTYEYDAYGDRSVEVDPEGDKRTWGYNEDSRRTSEVSPRGNVTGGEPARYTTTIERDAQGRPVVVSQPGPIVGKPVSRIAAAVSGETVEGQTLSAAPGVWEGAPSLSYAYQWERCGATGSGCAAVSGATGSSYVLGSVDVGHRIRVAVSASNASGSGSSTSAVSAVVSTVLMAHYNSQFGSKGAGAGQLASPYGVAVDSHGDVWVADVENNRVDEFSSARAFVEAVGWGVENGEGKLQVCKTSCRAGLKGAGEGELSEPAGVAFSGGNLYVVDSGNDRIEEFNEKSELVRAFGEKGAGAGQLEGPEAVTAAPGGNVWVADTKNRRVEEFTSSGVFVETLGWGVENGEAKLEVCKTTCRAGIEGSGAGQFNTPIGVAFDGTNLYVVDNVNDRVEEFNEKSEYVTSFGSKGKEAGQFEETTSIGVEASTGDLYVNDVGDNRIEQFTSAGGFIGQFGGPGVNGAQFKGPQGIAVTSTGSVYVVDDGNGRVQEFRPFTSPGSFVAPNISGEMIEAQTLTAGTGIWGAPPVTTYSYQWQRCASAGTGCVNITGATNNTYTIQNVDTGHELRVQVTAKNSAGSSTASSHPTQTLAGPHTTKYAYNAEGEVESETNPEGQTTTTTYNTSGLPTKVSQPNGEVSETEYDGAGQVVAQTDGNKHVTKYVRNVLEQVTEVIDPLSHKTKKTYDGAGNLATITDPESRVTTYGYNKENQVTKVSYSEAGMHAVEYAYTVNGQRESMVDATGTTSYGYDLLGRLTETKDGHGNKVAYGYDLANETTSVTYPNGKIVKYEYDKAGRISSLTDWLSHTTKFAYNPDSQLATVTFPEASGESDHYSYTPSGQISEASFQKASTTLASLTYVRSNTEQITRTAQTGLPGETAIEDSYDQNERLASSGTAGYEYDPANNPVKQAAASYTYNAADELESGAGNTYTFNQEGQRTKTTPATGPATTYGYNQPGSLTTVTRPEEGSTPKIEDSYTSNGDGLRVTETIGGKTSYLTWQLAGGLPLLLNDGTNSYIYGPENQPVEQINGEEHATYLHHDQAGSTRLLTNEKGEVTGAYTYGPYGETTGHTGTATTPLGYDAQYTSPDTGLIYLRARVYDPATAQFLGVDPLSKSTGAPYTYAGDNPLTFGDSYGLFSIPLIGDIGAGDAAGACGATAEIPGLDVITCGAAGAAAIYLGYEAASHIVNAVENEGEGSSTASSSQECEVGEAQEFSNPDRNPAQDKKLTPGEIQKLKDAGVDPHDFKEGRGSDLYKDREGNVYEKPIGGSGPGEPIGVNINQL